jgi:hypothetical protein
MSATIIREGLETTLPSDVCERAGVNVNDGVEWRYEDGEIRGRKIVADFAEVLDETALDPETLLPKDGKISAESIVQAIRLDRERQK